jgi:hypothetical protein
MVLYCEAFKKAVFCRHIKIKKGFMIFYRLFYLLSLLLAVLLLSGCGSTETISTYQKDSEIVVDGNLSGWPTSGALINDQDTFNFYVMQDSENLYIFVDFRSPLYNQAIENSGFIVYLSDDENNKKRRGIGYPAGAFNLLREDPAAYREMTRDAEWYSNTRNQQRLESLQEENFENVMIVERFDSGSNPQYGFVTHEQIAAEGVELAAERDQRYYGLEFKIPLDGSAPYELEPGKTYWLGFAIEPPEFNFRDTGMQQNHNRYRDRRRGARYGTSDQRALMRRQMGQFEEWFKIEIR